MSNFIRHDTCPKCKREDKLGVYDDNEHCFHLECGYHHNYTDTVEESETMDTELKAEGSDQAAPLKPLKIGLPKTPQPADFNRALSAEAIAKYQITTKPDNDAFEHVYPYFDAVDSSKHVGNKMRMKGEKDFRWEGDSKGCGLFGQQAFPPGGKAITVVEGECDAPAGYELTGLRYPCVGVRSASQAKGDCIRSFEYLNSFEQIVLCFDSDAAGQAAASQVAPLFPPGKVRVVKLQKAKDPNDYLKNGWVSEYTNEWYRAPVWLPDGLQLGSDPDFVEEIIQYKEPKSIPYPWEGLNTKTYGIRTSELVLITAPTGVGKTSIMKEIEFKILNNPELVEEGVGLGFMHLEEPKRDLALGLMSIEKNKPYHFPDVPRTEQELREVYKKVMDTDRIVIWDHFGSNEIDTVLNKIRHMHALGCKYIFLDHLSIIVSDQHGDERKQLDEISTKLKTLTMNLDISIICVIHVNRQGEIRGSAGPEQVANVIIRLERDLKEMDDWRRNITRVSIEKNRKFGRTGPASWLFYNEMTGRLEELSREDAERFEAGGNNAGHEFDTFQPSGDKA